MKKYKETELLSYIKENSAMRDDAVWLAVYTDRTASGLFASLPDNDGDMDTAHLLELRIFCEDREVLCRRDYMGCEFFVRMLDDSCGLACFDEEHFLDQDTTKTVSENGVTSFRTMGGGKYTLPVGKNTTRICVRTYFKSHDANGIEYPVDWRVVKFK